MKKVSIYDDLDGSDDAAEVTFKLSGTQYTADLSPANEKLVTEAVALLEQVLAVAQSSSPAETTYTRRSASEDARIRVWARETGRTDVPSKGRLSRALREEYEQALGEGYCVNAEDVA